jgi:hypothetical protein
MFNTIKSFILGIICHFCFKKSPPLVIIVSQTHAYFRCNITLPLRTDPVIGLFIQGFLVLKLNVFVVCILHAACCLLPQPYFL